MLIQVNQIYKSFASTTVLENIQLQVNENERVGLIGVNGAGKSTLLKMITGELIPDSGEIRIAKKCRIGYLAQHTGLDSDLTIWEELLRSFAHFKKMESELKTLEAEMGKEEVFSQEERYQKVLQSYANLQERYENQGGYAYEARIRGALHGLGLGSIPYQKTRISELSGGQKTRAALAKMLLEEPELLILDEPTNYLDMQAITWLEQTLKQYKGALLIVSHDRYFLDRLVTIIYEIERHKATRYVGNYQDYVKQKEANLLQQQKAYEQQQEEIQKMEDFVQKNLARASTTKRAQSRRKTLEKIERLESPTQDNRLASIRFDIDRISGKQVLQADRLTIGYDKPLYQFQHLLVERGERIAILGPNGTGKTTFLKTISSKIDPLAGSFTFGTNVTLDYYDQEQDELTLDNEVIDELWNQNQSLDQTTIRSYLGQFLFSGEDVFKQVKDLSGGEKARLSLLKHLLRKGNFMLMDEPTNHLDMRSKEKLEEALEAYPGTLLFVSHDRYFINRLATRIWELTPDGLVEYDGNYERYLEKKALEKYEEEQQAQEQVATPISSSEQYRQREKEEKKLKRKREQKITGLELEIARLEKEIAEIHEKLCQPEVYNDAIKSASIRANLEANERLLHDKTEEWAKLADESS
ncbi:ABC-F family ATP-binding cassette domain-containing protein [Hazenella sp. IB182357]|uniref:ABC-F family ATP-binding cassette domain-containing protein n=1 Tax=Polycladospora coralii TaxID=2771432 RepID=A0A926RX88_9BACL|nr:ABC-F family ATP-binding cassette domain-containing protein [Polycladospora coralii]MBD1372286.1 ABC-F family ATP-binding cassette domain-containing protein [Polycladospora coralii]